MRKIENNPRFQAQLARQESATPYIRAALQAARSSQPDEDVLETLRLQLSTTDDGLDVAVEISSHGRSDFISDRRYRLLSALAGQTPVGPIDPNLQALFETEEELGRKPLEAAFRQLSELEPGLEAMASRTPVRTDPEELRGLVGIGARAGTPVLMSDISASIVNQYLRIQAGELRGDVDTPYFEAPRVSGSSGSIGPGAPRRPTAQN